ncbi:unnamed protein product, partial [Polarella glacialis]
VPAANSTPGAVTVEVPAANSTSGAATAAMPPLRPLRAVAYGALPCSTKAPCSTVPSEDMVQAGYEQQWGAAPGRDDLGTMKALGANAVRLYHSMGTGSEQDHGGFLDRAQALQLNVMPGMHSNEP